MPTKKTTEEFIQDAIKVHGDRYDYSKVEYINNRTKVTIICKVHGKFTQLPPSHLTGKGCSKCGRLICGKKLTMDCKLFIKKAKEVHGDKYDYSKVEYDSPVFERKALTIPSFSSSRTEQVA